MNGYAIECRINAEDTFLDFAPSTGHVPDVTIPSGPGVRCDTYLYPGCTVSPFYDSLMAKLCTWGQTFEESRTRMLNALDDFYIQGVETSIPLYKTIFKTKKRIKKQDAALAAAALYSTYYSSTIKAIPESSTHWKSKLDRA